MKTALVTTTINVPEVLRLYRACSPIMPGCVKFFVAIDKKTPEEAVNLCQYDIPNTQVCFLQEQEQYACSDLIGWNTIGRRSIAILEALKWGAEIIVTIDDDNIPMSTDYFDRFEMVLGASFSGLKATSVNPIDNWFDVGQHLAPPAAHRGFPSTKRATNSFTHAVDARIGVAAGICLGDPDVDAVTRIVNRSWSPHISGGVSELLRAGIAVQPGTHTVFNSQNTAFLRELAPCFLMCPQFGRYDDIFASLIAQRVMRERDLHVHFGQPFVWQQRNPHDLLKDLRAEMWGMQHVVEFAEWLDHVDLPRLTAKQEPYSILDNVRTLYAEMQELPWMPAGVSELGLAWCDDCEKVVG